jgi:hypothetical protein
MTEKEDIKRKIQILDEMIGSLVNLLKEKGVIDGDEWEKYLEKRLEKTRRLKKFEDLD